VFVSIDPKATTPVAAPQNPPISSGGDGLISSTSLALECDENMVDEREEEREEADVVDDKVVSMSKKPPGVSSKVYSADALLIHGT
jgi:hypothetical protein